MIGLFFSVDSIDPGQFKYSFAVGILFRDSDERNQSGSTVTGSKQVVVQ